jgi:hypothetical protein
MNLILNVRARNRDLSNYWKKKSKNNIQDLGFLAKCECIMCTTIVYQRTAKILVCSVC